MRKRFGSLLAVSAIVFAACSSTATTAPSAPAPGTPAPSTATVPSAPPSQAPVPISITNTSYKPVAVGHTGGNLVLGISGDPDTVWAGIYGTYANDAEAFENTGMWGLWSNTSDLKYYGQLATDVPTADNKEVVMNSAGGMDVTVNMIPGANWSDGQPINCDDVIYMWHWQMDPGQSAAGNVQGVQGYQDISSIDGAGTSTCVIHFSKVYEPFLGLFAPLLPAHYLKTASVADAIKKLYVDTGLKTAVWSGPYMPTAWAHDSQINYVPNPQFWTTIKKGTAPFDAVTMKFYADTTSEIAGFVNGEIDAALEFNQNDVASMSAVDPAAIDKVPSVTYEQHSWNYADLVKKFGAAGAKAMMEALHYAYDKDAINTTITGGAVTPTCNFTNAQAWFNDPSITCYAHDAAKAASILAAAGFVKGSDGLLALNGNKADLLGCTRSDRPYRIDTLNLVASQLLPLGIKLTVKGATSANLFAGWSIAADTPCNLTHGNFDVAEFAWIATPDPGSLYILYDSKFDPSVGDHSGQNYVRANIPALDTALLATQTTVDLPTLKTTMATVQQIYADPSNGFPEIPLYDWTTVMLKSAKLHNVSNNGSATGQTWNIQDWWRDQ
jgi:peptide/nickel transport system substrate-binding protein